MRNILHLQHSPGVAILNAVSDPVFLNFESSFSNGESGFSSRRVRIFFESESGFSCSPGFLLVRVRVRVRVSKYAFGASSPENCEIQNIGNSISCNLSEHFIQIHARNPNAALTEKYVKLP